MSLKIKDLAGGLADILIPFNPSVSVVFGGKLSVVGAASITVTQEGSISGGLVYEGGVLNVVTQPSKPVFTRQFPSTLYGADAKLSIGLKFGVTVVSIATPWAVIDGYLHLTSNNLRWDLYGGLEARAGMDMNVLGLISLPSIDTGSYDILGSPWYITGDIFGPTVTSITPNSGPASGGTIVTITGTRFQNGATVKIGSVSCTNVSFISATQLTATTPSNVTGVYNVVVTNPDNGSGNLLNFFTFTGTSIPTVTGLSATTGSNLNPTTITIIGTGFFGGGSSNMVTAVKIGTTSLTVFTTASDINIKVPLPLYLIPGTYDVTVTTSGGTSVTSSADKYTVTGISPAVTGLSVNTGSNLSPTTITVSGSGFFGGLSSSAVTAIRLGTTSLSWYVEPTDGSIGGVVIPSGFVNGTYDLTVTTWLGGTSATSSADQFIVTGGANGGGGNGNIVVDNVSLVNKDTVGHTNNIRFDIAWDNSWFTAGAPSPTANWDAAWVFAKYSKSSDGGVTWSNWGHCTLLNTGNVAPAGSQMSFGDTGGVYKGTFIYRSSAGSGSVDWNAAEIRWSYGNDTVADSDLVQVKVFAIEMVYIPAGPFYVGDTV